MNEKLSEALVELISLSVSGVEFLVSEIPDVLHQLLIWEATISVISMVCWVILCIAIYKFNRWQIGYLTKNKKFNDPNVMANIFQGFLIIPLTGLFDLTFLKIWIAPKVFLIEYAAQLVK